MAIGKALKVRQLSLRVPGALSPRVPVLGPKPARFNMPATNFGNYIKADWVFQKDPRALRRVSDTVNNKIDGAYRYIMHATRQAARKSIRKALKSQPHSKPGEAVRSRTGIYKDTIERDYNPSTKVAIVGPKSTKRPGAMPDGSTIIGNQTLPNLLEYGGVIHAPKPTVIKREFADPRAVKAYWKKERYRRYKGSRKPRKKKAYLLRDVTHIVIPPGYRIVDPRPTMRLAFNKVVNYRSLKRAFDRIGVSDPSSLRRDTPGLRI